MGKPTERMLYLLLSQFYDKPVIKAILEVIGEEFEYHEQLKEQIRTQIWPDVAVGKQLDMCGEVADISRKVDAVIMSFSDFPSMATRHLVRRSFTDMVIHTCLQQH